MSKWGTSDMVRCRGTSSVLSEAGMSPRLLEKAARVAHSESDEGMIVLVALPAASWAWIEVLVAAITSRLALCRPVPVCVRLEVGRLFASPSTEDYGSE